MRNQECLNVLLDPDVSLEEKANHFTAYVSWYEALARNAGIGVLRGREYAFKDLLKTIPPEENEKRKNLTIVIPQILEHLAHGYNETEAKTKAKIDKLRSLPPGTIIVINNRGSKHIVRLLEVKRTKFVCECPDGRRFRVPGNLFLDVHNDASPAFLADAERERRDLVRSFVYGNRFSARKSILALGIDILPTLLDELSATLHRIQNAPVGFSNGVLRDSLGLLSKVNPHDQQLVKMIRETFDEMLKSENREKALEIVSAHSDEKVRHHLAGSFEPEK